MCVSVRACVRACVSVSVCVCMCVRCKIKLITIVAFGHPFLHKYIVIKPLPPLQLINAHS